MILLGLHGDGVTSCQTRGPVSQGTRGAQLDQTWQDKCWCGSGRSYVGLFRPCLLAPGHSRIGTTVTLHQEPLMLRGRELLLQKVTVPWCLSSSLTLTFSRTTSCSTAQPPTPHVLFVSVIEPMTPDLGQTVDPQPIGGLPAGVQKTGQLCTQVDTPSSRWQGQG